MDILRAHNLGACSHEIGKPNANWRHFIMRDAKEVYRERAALCTKFGEQNQPNQTACMRDNWLAQMLNTHA